jgi:hypothetical protein
MAQTNTDNLRKKIISFAWTWIGMLIFIGIMSLFSIWSINRAYEDGSAKLIIISELQNQMLLAKVHFKTQVQEWKNILLRGGDNKDKFNYLSSFEAEQTKVVNNLKDAQKICLSLRKQDICQSIEEARLKHLELGIIYKKTLNEGSLENNEGASEIDQKLRGIDRALDNDLGTIFQKFSDVGKTQLSIIKQSVESRHKSLKKFILGVMLAALILSGIGLHSILRMTES